MAKWSISPTTDVISDWNGGFGLPKNTGTTDVTYTIEYEDDNGCKSTTSYTIPAQAACQPKKKHQFCVATNAYEESQAMDGSGQADIATRTEITSYASYEYITLDGNIVSVSDVQYEYTWVPIGTDGNLDWSRAYTTTSSSSSERAVRTLDRSAGRESYSGNYVEPTGVSFTYEGNSYSVSTSGDVGGCDVFEF